MGVTCRRIMTDHDSPSSTDPAEIEAVIARLQQSNLAASDTRLIARLLRLLLQALSTVMSTVGRAIAKDIEQGMSRQGIH